MIEPKRFVRDAKCYVPPMEGRRGKIRLDFNENTWGPSPKVMERLRTLSSEIISTYPEYQKAYDLFSEKFGIDRSRMLVTNGSDEAIRLTYNAYISPGDKVVIPVPTFAIFGLEAELFGANAVEVPYNKDLSFPEDEVIEASEGARMTIVVTPNNPTGTSASLDAIESIAQRSEVVFVDEAYHEFKGISALPLIEDYDNIIVTRTFSKAYGLAGLRVGLVFANEGIIDTLRKVVSPYSVNSIAIECAMAAMQDQGYMRSCVERIIQSRERLASGLRSLGFKVFDSDANFIICDLGKEHKRVVELLKGEKILIRDRSGDRLLENCIRLSAGTMEETEKLLEALQRNYGDRG
ncbi:MAG: histidinol-phosphate transaminase [Candidatus Methanofastidiosa archaeon]|nr:histidinol-phosphate transaminase [Candidatus Methanofastidiosa archaeon]